ncbi:FprA family A-type flavoprotein [Candidatus Latescibacterota bacterium]
METVYEAVKINEYIFWVGAIDWNIRDFHGYSTNRGSTYNAFLILTDKITLMDTVKEPFRNEMISRISSIIDPGEISYVISNHSEMDHSGCLWEIIDIVKPEKVFASVMGVKALTAHFHNLKDIIAVKEGDSISLGNMDVNFIETRMLHWPDSMFSYLPAEKLLFSNDAFGMHLASNERYADEIDDYIIENEGEKYFSNILLLYSSLVLKLLDKVKSIGLELDMILPDHGPIWRTKEDIAKILNYYAAWAEQKPVKKAVILYDTMWGSTEKMAHVISEGLANDDIEIHLFPMKTTHRSDVVKEILKCGALIVGSSTLNNNILPTIADVMTYLKGLRPKNLIGASFGSYGWSGESIGQLDNILKEMGVEIIGESIKAQYVPNADDLARCFNLGKTIAEKLNTITL